MVENYGEFFYLYNPIPLEKHEANLVINLILKTNNVKYEIGEKIDLNESFKDDVVNRLRFKNYFERLKDSGDQRGYSIEGFMCGLFGGDLNMVREDSWDFKVGDITIQQKHIASNDDPRLISYKGVFNTLSGESVQKLNTFCEEHKDKEDEVKSHLFTYELPIELDEIKKEILEKRILFDYLIISTFEEDKLVSHLISKEKVIELCLDSNNIRRSKSIYNIRISKKAIIQHGKTFEIIKPTVTSEECGYLLTMDEKKKKTSEIFGEYGSKIRPDILDWIASQPRKFLNEAEAVVKELERIREIENKTSPLVVEKIDDRIKQLVFLYLDTITEGANLYEFKGEYFIINPINKKWFFTIANRKLWRELDISLDIHNMYKIHHAEIENCITDWIKNFMGLDVNLIGHSLIDNEEISDIIQNGKKIKTFGSKPITESINDGMERIVFAYLDLILKDFKTYKYKNEDNWFVNPITRKFGIQFRHDSKVVVNVNILYEISNMFNIKSFDDIMEYIINWYNTKYQTNYENTEESDWTDFSQQMVYKITKFSTTINEKENKLKEGIEYEFDEKENKLKEVIFEYLNQLSKEFKILKILNSTWLINPKTNEWIFELQRSGSCWFNDKIENELRLMFGIRGIIYIKLVVKYWVKEKLNTHVPYLSFVSNSEEKIKQVLAVAKATNKSEMGEQEDTGGSGPAPPYPAVTKWETGIKRGPANTIDPKSKWSEVVPIVRGKANPIDQKSKWDSGVARGKANTLL